MSTVDDLMARVRRLVARGAWADQQIAEIRAALESALAAEYERGRNEREQDAEPVAWMESPHGAIRANPLYRWELPSQTLAWQIPLYASPPKPQPRPGPDAEPVAWAV